MGAIGVDLAASPRRVTGLCYLDDDLMAEVSRSRSDEEIISFIRGFEVGVVAIDAPLSLPRAGSLRRCEEELRKIGVRALPPLMHGMKRLTERAIRLKDALTSQGYAVIEVFPTGARRFLGLPSKKHGVRALRDALISLGVRGLPEDADQHVLDAAICALIGLHYLRGEYVEFGDWEEGVIVMPRPRSPEGWPAREEPWQG